MRRAFALILCMCLLLCGCGNESKQQTEGNIITIPFEFGDRKGPYIGETDKDGIPHGYGIFSSEKSNGTKWTYSGQWDHGHWNGHGQTIWEDGESYSGMYAGDEIKGLGIHTHSSGEISIGNIDNGLNGQGMFITTDGVTIMGNFIDGVPAGYCSVYLTGKYEGYVFWGFYENGNATGTVYAPDGKVAPATHIDGNIDFEILGFSDPTVPETIPAEPEAEPTTEPAIEPATETKETEKTGITYVLNTNTRKFHYPSCSSAKKTKESNKATFTGTRDEVIAKGYQPCGNCHP